MERTNMNHLGELEELRTPDDICERLNVKKSFFYAPIRRKGADPIPCVTVGKYLRYRLSDVMAWIERQNRAQG